MALVSEIKLSQHAKERMMERDVTMAELREVLRTGSKQKHQSKVNCFVYHGRQDGMKIIFNAKENLVITVFYNDRRGYVL